MGGERGAVTSTAVPWFGRERIRAAVWSPAAQRFVITVILVNAVVLGVQTVRGLGEPLTSVLHAIDMVCLAVYVVEIGLKLYADRTAFFRRGWNVFDLLVVAVTLVPGGGQFAVLRALRVFRVLRLISVVPALRRVVGALGRALPGIASVGALMAIVFYIGAVMATELFGEEFPELFGNLGASLFTLFQLTTFDNWSVVVRAVAEVYPSAWAFFIVFVVVSGLTMLNLVIAVIVDAMQHVAPAGRSSEDAREDDHGTAPAGRDAAVPAGPSEATDVVAELAALREQVVRLTDAVERGGRPPAP